MVSCGTQNTGSNADNQALSVLDLLLQQDNFDAADFGLENNPDVAGNMVNQEELDADDTEKDEIIPDDTPIENPVIPTPPESLPPTGEMQHIRDPGDYDNWKSKLGDNYKCFPASETPIYPIKIWRYSSKYGKQTSDETTVIINPTTAVDMCQRIGTDPKQSKNKILVIHTNAGSGTHHGAIQSMMHGNWKHPGYHISIDVEGYCNSNRLDNENTYGCKNNKASVSAPYFKDKVNSKGVEYREWNHQLSPYKNKDTVNGNNVKTRKSDSIQIINVVWLGNNVNIGNPYANKANGDWLTKATMTKKQAHSLAKLIKAFIKKYPNIQIAGHNQVGPTIKDCPCFNVPKWLELCGIPSKNIYETFHDLPGMDGEQNPRSPDWWNADETYGEGTFFIKNADKMFKELGDISTWNITPPVAAQNPTNQPSNNSNPNIPKPLGKRWQDMDCSEFTVYHNDNWKNISPSIRTGRMNSMSDEDREDLMDRTRECIE